MFEIAELFPCMRVVEMLFGRRRQTNDLLFPTLLAGLDGGQNDSFVP
jgi:hypothetical protein